MARQVAEVIHRVTIGSRSETNDLPWLVGFHGLMFVFVSVVLILLIRSEGWVQLASIFGMVVAAGVWGAVGSIVHLNTESHIQTELKKAKQAERHCQADLDAAEGEKEKLSLQYCLISYQLKQKELEEKLESLRAFRRKVRLKWW